MRSYSQNQPTGTGRDADFFQQILRQLREELQFYDSETVRFECMTRGIRAHARVGFGSTPGIHWQDPKELDTTTLVPKDTLVYVSPDNPLVTSPATDSVLGVVTAAQAGTWLALQDVPANTIVGSVVWYNVPQLPTPGTVTGTPLKGDLDVTTQFWARIERASLC